MNLCIWMQDDMKKCNAQEPYFPFYDLIHNDCTEHILHSCAIEDTLMKLRMHIHSNMKCSKQKP